MFHTIKRVSKEVWAQGGRDVSCRAVGGAVAHVDVKLVAEEEEHVLPLRPAWERVYVVNK